MDNYYTAALVLSLTLAEFKAMKAAFKVLNAVGIYGDEATDILLRAHARKLEHKTGSYASK